MGGVWLGKEMRREHPESKIIPTARVSVMRVQWLESTGCVPGERGNQLGLSDKYL